MPANKRYSEKLASAVYALAVREGDVRHRLEGAYFYLKQLQPDDIPTHASQEFFSVLRALTNSGPELDSDGTVLRTAVRYTMARIKNSTGRAYAQRIFALYRDTLASPKYLHESKNPRTLPD